MAKESPNTFSTKERVMMYLRVSHPWARVMPFQVAHSTCKSDFWENIMYMKEIWHLRLFDNVFSYCERLN
jgi:hypothetical protein